MTAFDPHIDRAHAARLGQEAIEIVEAGGYAAPSGAHVDIRESVERAREGTVEYPPDAALPGEAAGSRRTLVEVTPESTLGAARRLVEAGRRPAALNFASAMNPGGGFLGGARAQEESICRSSALFGCIRGRRMYPFHREYGDDLYSDWAIHSPDVPVFRGDDHRLLERPFACSVVTCAAPNVAAQRRFDPRRMPEVEPAYRARIARVLAIGTVHEHAAMVLGAWGCGAFGGDPAMVSRLFREALEGPFRGAFEHVVFAIVDSTGKRRSFGPFERELSGMCLRSGEDDPA